MRSSISYYMFIFSFCIFSCSKKLEITENLSDDDRESVYKVLKDVSYGSDTEQVMDIYLSHMATSFGNRNYTVVFLNGGGYYFSDKSQEGRYIEPYIKKGLNVINLNYLLKRWVIIDLTRELKFLKAKNADYGLKLDNKIVTGFFARAHIATNMGLAQNNPAYPDKLEEGIQIVGIINFSIPVDDLNAVERIFTEHENELFKTSGKALLAAEDYESKENIPVFEPITCFDPNDPPIFFWPGVQDEQIPPSAFERFVTMLRKTKDFLIYLPEARHSPIKEQLKNAYIEIFKCLIHCKNIAK
jgi:acetyl esterase/lipase